MRDSMTNNMKNNMKNNIIENIIGEINMKRMRVMEYINDRVICAEKIGGRMTRGAILLATVCVLFVTGCDDALVVEPTSKSIITIHGEAAMRNIPFATEAELHAIDTSDPEVIPWKFARTMLYFDLRFYEAEEHGWQSATLSERPVIIYDSRSRPRYYEFIVHENGDAIGTMTAYARKVSTNTLSHVLPYTRDYEYDTVSSKGSAYAQVDIHYPRSVGIGILSKSGDDVFGVADIHTGEAVDAAALDEQRERDVNEWVSDPDIRDALEDMAEYYSEQQYSISDGDVSDSTDNSEEDAPSAHPIGGDIRSIIDTIETQQEEFEKRVVAYWDMMAQLPDPLPEIDDAEIDEFAIDTKWKFFGYESRGNRHQRTQITYNEALLRTQWRGWCVPSAIAWAYRIFYDSYKGTYLPLFDKYHQLPTIPLVPADKIEIEESVVSFENIDENKSGKYWERCRRCYSGSQTGHYNFNGYLGEEDKTNLNAIEKHSKKIDGGLYYDLARVGNIDGLIKGAVFPDAYDTMARYVTNNAYAIYWQAFDPDHFLTLNPIYSLHKHIYDKKMPAFVLGFFRSNADGKKGGHMVVLAGSDRRDRKQVYYFLGLEFPAEPHLISNTFLVHDNGHVTSGGTDAPGAGEPFTLAPFWVDSGYFLYGIGIELFYHWRRP